MRAPKESLLGDHQLIHYRIRGKELRWLKTLHICFASMWGGATICITVIQFMFEPQLAAEMFAYRTILLLVDTWVVAPAALLCMLTGFFYSAMTNFGFFKYWWIIIKWVVTTGYVVVGFLWLTPWLEMMVRFSRNLPPDGMVPPGTILQSAMNMTVALTQLAVVSLMILITILKPWGHTKWHV
ncbi:MAG: hypothetical protein HY795_11730 [Desulfovibrio sp.]|nr:hypothetical protein [Desulfovibrio sp.]MBI4959964.1 hypothetical protein [Desulfovibrio sp.]